VNAMPSLTEQTQKMLLQTEETEKKRETKTRCGGDPKKQKTEKKKKQIPNHFFFLTPRNLFQFTKEEKERRKKGANPSACIQMKKKEEGERERTYVEELVELDGAILVGVDLLNQLTNPESWDILLTNADEDLTDLLGINVAVPVSIELLEDFHELSLLIFGEVGGRGGHFCGGGSSLELKGENWG